MKFEDIIENHVHHYSYFAAGKFWEGKGEVKEKLSGKKGGDRVMIHDEERNKTLTLFASQITKAARIPKVKAK